MHEKVLSLEFIFQKILFYLYAFFYNILYKIVINTVCSKHSEKYVELIITKHFTFSSLLQANYRILHLFCRILCIQTLASKLAF